MSDTLHELRVPRDTVNDDFVTVVRWLFADGEAVPLGRPVVELETSKSVIDVESTAAGILSIGARPGEKVGIGGLLGRVEPSGAAVAASPGVVSAPAAGSPAPSSRAASAGDATVRTISLPARRLMEQHGITEDQLPVGLVRESDVAALVAARTAPSASSARPLPASPAAPRGLLGDARRSAGERNVGLPWLVLNYLWRNWFLGNLARISPRGVITVVHRLRGVRMGSNCFIDPNAILETAYPENISLGDDVRVAAGAIVMTHIKAPHYLRDAGFVPNTVRPVRLDDHCFIGVNAVVMPGVTVGRASVVASGAVVTGDVPPFTMVAGNPAKVVKRFSPAGGMAE